MMSSPAIPTEAPKELAEMMHFLCAIGRVVSEAYTDDHRITLLESLGMVGLLREAVPAFMGVKGIAEEVDRLTPAQTHALAGIPAQHFQALLPAQHAHIATAVLACLPSLTNLIQVIRRASDLAADFPGPAPKAQPVP